MVTGTTEKVVWVVRLIRWLCALRAPIRMRWYATLCRFTGDRIRVSCGLLIRIKEANLVLLVPSQNIGLMMQPPGGVARVIPAGSRDEVLKEFAPEPTLEKRHKPGDEDDLRITIPGKYLCKFQKWWKSRRDRELFPVREFREELIDSGLFPESLRALAVDAHFKLYMSRIVGPRKSEFYGGTKKEILLHEYFDLVDLSEAQMKEISKHRASSARPVMSEDAEYGWFSIEEIRRGGAVPEDKQVWEIASHAAWMMGIERA